MDNKELLQEIKKVKENNRKQLNLSGKNLSELPSEIWELTSLTTLNLGNNRLTQLPSEIGALINLTNLQIWNNRQLMVIPSEIGQLTNLTQLDLNRTTISGLPPEIGHLVNLTELSVWGTRLTSLPPEIGHLVNLTELSVWGTRLTSLPPEIGKLANLTNLEARDCQITSLPEEICELVNLRKLDLRNNQLDWLPARIDELVRLEKIDLRGNMLSIPLEILEEVDKPIRITAYNRKLLEEIAQRFEKGDTSLNLSGCGLVTIPPEISQFTNLTHLDLSDNPLTNISSEIGQLTKLTFLDLSRTPSSFFLSDDKTFDPDDTSVHLLTELPPEIGKLSNLEYLDLKYNDFTQFPPEIGKLSNLIHLGLAANRISSLPAEIGKLTRLKQLDLTANQVIELCPEIGMLSELTQLDLDDNLLVELPTEIGQLTNLKTLNLSGNELTSLPSQMGQLENLTNLNISGNKLSSLPKEFGQLTNLEWFDPSLNQLVELPPTIGQLTKLRQLNLVVNKLVKLPSELGGLICLTELNLRGNQLAELPPEVGDLNKLVELDLTSNHLNELPLEIGGLSNLKELKLWGNTELHFPPPAIVDQGTEAILVYLRGLRRSHRRQWLSKLLVVGEGGVGKTSLLKVMQGEEFNPSEPVTHGLRIHQLEFLHPTEVGINMKLNAWDFGGQQIQHATHQFFLTNRSLFLLVWDARHGYERGKLYYWLDAIQALAPDSPVIIVATHIDQWDADLPLTQLRKKYPSIVGYNEVSNVEGTGINELKSQIASIAAKLPLMGEPWPTNWLNAANDIRSKTNEYISPKELREIMLQHKVFKKDAAVLAQLLHDLGDILFFQKDHELNRIVILKPQWVTEYISKVLKSKDNMLKQYGIFTQGHMAELWRELAPEMRNTFLGFMERFDLSYKTLDQDNQEVSLVVERLPLDPPPYEEQWQSITKNESCREISMKFVLNTIPAGIPTWFIARSHRFTTHTHWRDGALFAYSSECKHLALVQAYPHDNYLTLTVRGPMPQNFFALLKDGIEVTLARFPGLQIKRMIPCPGHNGAKCDHEFNYDHLLKAIERNPPIEELQCPTSFEGTPVSNLLFGLHWRTQNVVLNRLDELEVTITEGRDEILAELNDLRELTQREFTSTFRREQSKIETHCPNIFVLRPHQSTKSWRKAIQGEKFDLQLYCQEPGQWHPTEDGGLYHLNKPAKWISATAPYLQRLVTVLKYASPFISPVLGIRFPDYEEIIKNDLALMEELVKVIPTLQEESGQKFVKNKGTPPDSIEWEMVEGAALRMLRLLLDEMDSKQHWGGLKKALTPEGHYLWLCEKHAAVYQQ